MAAALNALEASYVSLRARDHRGGLAHARRAAGMAVNALLVVEWDDRFGRSYAEHLVGLAGDARVADEVRTAARRLIEAPARLELVTIGAGSVELAEAAKAVLVWVADRLPAEDAPADDAD
jgi:hypothetical protein